MKLLKNISKIIHSKNFLSTEDYNFEFCDSTKAVMQKNFKTLSNLRIAYTFNDKFDDFASQITEKKTIEDFIISFLGSHDDLMIYLTDCVELFNYNPKSKQLPEFLFIASALNDIYKLQYPDANDLFLSLSHSPAYKDTPLNELRTNLHNVIANINTNADLFESIQNNTQNIKNYLNIAFISNLSAKNPTNWINYEDYSKIDTSTVEEISSINEAIIHLTDGASISNVISVYNFIKKKYLSNNDKSSAGFCNSELEREYKASIMLANLISHLELNKLASAQSVGFNLLARIKNIPAIIEEQYPLAQATNILNKFDSDAEILVNEMLKGILIFTSNDKTEISNIKSAPITQIPLEEKYACEDKQTHIKKQLEACKKILEKKLVSLTKTIAYLTKNINRKSSFSKHEQTLDLLSDEFGVELTSIDEQPKPILRSQSNTLLLIDAIHERYDEIRRALVVFDKVRKKMGIETNLQGVDFDKALLGDLTHICSDYQEKIVRDFYHLIDAAPTLNTNNTFRTKTTTFTMAQLKERAWITKGLSQEFKYILQAIEFTPAQQENYQQDKMLEQKFIEKQIGENENDFELIINN